MAVSTTAHIDSVRDATRLAGAALPLVVGVGQPSAGDDGVAHTVIERLTAHAAHSHINAEIRFTTDPTQLVEWLRRDGPAYIVDAVVGADEPGQVLVLSPEDFETLAASAVSSHGVNPLQALQLCNLLYPDEVTAKVMVFAISIEAPREYQVGLSSRVARAAQHCAESLLALLNQTPETSNAHA